MTEPLAIQPVGFHLGLSSEWQVTSVSENLEEFLDVAPDAVLGQPISAVFSDAAIHDVRNRMSLLRGEDAIEHLFHYPLTVEGPAFDLAIYRAGKGFAIEGEPCTERGIGDATGILAGMMSRIEPSDDIKQLCDQACSQLRALTGYQQVVIMAGQVQLGQSMRSQASQFGTSEAAANSDMVVFDRDAAAVPVQVVDASWSMPHRLLLQSPNKTESTRLKTIGARSALIVPLDRDGRAWGQVACYHSSPRHVSAERRNIARLFAGFVSLRIELAELRASRG